MVFILYFTLHVFIVSIQKLIDLCMFILYPVIVFHLFPFSEQYFIGFTLETKPHN